MVKIVRSRTGLRELYAPWVRKINVPSNSG